MQLEAVTPAHRAFAVRGNADQYLVGVTPKVVAHGYHCAVNECYVAAMPESAKPHEHEHLHEHAGHKPDEAVVGQGFRKVTRKVLPDEEEVIVPEVAECTEMEIHQHGNYLAFRHAA